MDLKIENRQLRQRLKELTRKAQQNQETLGRFHARELELLSAETLPELFSSMTEGLKASFEIKSLQLLLQDPNHEIRHLLYKNGLDEKAFPLLDFVDDMVKVNPRFQRLRSPWLGPFLSPEYDTLFSDIEGLKSIAILPLIRQNRLIGSINLGSSEEDRFSRQLATDFLARLATICTVCLENSVNREHILISGLTDPLTGLHNRRYLDRRLTEELARAGRYRHPLSCLFIDADHFKGINDNHGHQAGDAVLRELANRIRSQLRASDIATRFGGEEFALLLPQTSLDEALLLAERIRLEVNSQPIALGDGSSLQLSVSIGVSETRPLLSKTRQKADGEQLLVNADQALYQAKANGRNRIEFNLQKNDVGRNEITSGEG
ncbi:MAG: diguanylate cyclase [gamma proteobacterium symbiont of Ctena orbiculata]|uniref:diguanylate cyclase n=1 Tax=Candidatus Thiodiazotropha taylori TaxID=2792791 RepID=A0A944M8D6_9GAMM|nr:sensor domain-containing diguanylate cyclase [Candidatus Thiodiazotropha taylori]PUB85964.1 MAG: sensor domain-containing diguanylate cyclase [gamma proteobacterium symbiont of Ctena orbiculata]MBT3025588.1 sensor domain-containing diguanylate cyclase [Candidatus Thiodiazotropha taylori]MBT3033939.1 sensor domain-containing diguanylate cyclase [Candidatus Thiodiazotropha taylori]MBV2135392.1 sensor domain-containing diguanylate cyclase [Candidatus Thiodiazotropha taylori]